MKNKKLENALNNIFNMAHLYAREQEGNEARNICGENQNIILKEIKILEGYKCKYKELLKYPNIF